MLPMPHPTKQRNEAPEVFDGRVREWDLVRAFMKKHNLIEITNTRDSARMLMLSGGAWPLFVSEIMAKINPEPFEMIAGPFDHGRLFARKGYGKRAVALVGSPYELRAEHLEILQEIESLGLKVTVDNDTIYRHPQTLRVIVWRQGEEPQDA